MIPVASVDEGISEELLRLILWVDGYPGKVIERPYVEALGSVKLTRRFLLARSLRRRRGGLYAFAAAAAAVIVLTVSFSLPLRAERPPIVAQRPLLPKQEATPLPIPSFDPPRGRADPFKALVVARVAQERASMLPPPRLKVLDTSEANTPPLPENVPPPSENTVAALPETPVFAPEAAPPALIEATPPPVIEPKLGGVISDEKGAIALIQYGERSLFLREGERDGKVLVLSIAKDKIMLKAGTDVFRLRLE